MKITATAIPDIKIIEPQVFGDDRGYFFESFNAREFKANGIEFELSQANESQSSYGVVRGLHYQEPPYMQSKIVRVTVGAVLDVAVDIRKNSPTFGRHVAVELSGQNKKALWIPRGFAHGFAALSQQVIFSYFCDGYYTPSAERTILFNDPDLAIDWRIEEDKLQLSPKDRRGVSFKDFPGVTL